MLREHYIAQIRPFFDSGLVKVITGIRGCGKSTLLGQIEEALRSRGKRTLVLNCDLPLRERGGFLFHRGITPNRVSTIRLYRLHRHYIGSIRA